MHEMYICVNNSVNVSTDKIIFIDVVHNLRYNYHSTLGYSIHQVSAHIHNYYLKKNVVIKKSVVFAIILFISFFLFLLPVILTDVTHVLNTS